MKFIYLLVFLPLITFGQKETSHWYFGQYAAFNFQNGSPISISTSTLYSALSSSGISDSLGNLLFYVRAGDIVYNKNNIIMANGQSTGGSYLGTQASVVIRKSGSQYYLITLFAGYQGTPVNPPMFRYSIVDMSLNSGLGAVTTFTGQAITAPNNFYTCKMAATKHCNKQDHWLLVHQGGFPGSTNYEAYLVTSAGISATPVITSIGSIQPTASFVGHAFYRGFHKFSPNGRKVCSTMPNKTVELYDFDNSTGVLSNCIKLDSSFVNVPFTVNTPEAIGIEFSPDGTKLYISYNNHPRLYQYNLCAGSNSAIAASKTLIGGGGNDSIANNGIYMDLQNALDGKIYAANNLTINRLGVINNPNALGTACSYSPIAVLLGTTVSTGTNAIVNSGLPKFVSSFFEQKPTLTPISSSISCGVISFTPPNLCAAAGYSVTNYNWYFGDSLSGVANTSNLANPSHTFITNGIYNVRLVLNYYPCGSDTLKQTVSIGGLPSFSIAGKSTICKGESTLLSLNGAVSYSLNTTALAQNSVVVQPTINTTYTFFASDATGCKTNKTYKLNVMPCTFISESEIVNGISVFPNPVNKILTIECHLFNAENKTEIEILNQLGQVVYSKKISSANEEIDLSQWTKGIYTLLIHSGDKTASKKLILY